jgi:hypothetical protein
LVTRFGAFGLLATVVAATLAGAGPVPVDPDLPSYQPRPFTLRKDAGYVLRDGSIQIIGAQGMDVAFKNLNALFIKSHPRDPVHDVAPCRVDGDRRALLQRLGLRP